MKPSRVLAGLLLLFLGGIARGHGGQPLSTAALERGGRLYVPAQYWGIFIGGEGQPWRWICDEAINSFQLRDLTLGLDGTLYATDFPGLTVSHDGGCTWTPVSGAVAGLVVNGLVPDPVPGTGDRRVWLAGTGDGVPGALYRSDDAGGTWTAIHPADPAQDPTQYLMRGVVLSGDGRLHVLVDEGVEQDQPVIFTSVDGGQHFTKTPLQPVPADVVAGRSRPVYADPSDGGVVYVHVMGDTDQVLLRVDTGSGAATEILRVHSYIFDVKRDPATGRLLAATMDGLFAGDGDGPLQQVQGLSQAQCLALSGGSLYACASDLAPDRAAVAISRDGGASFGKVFQFEDTAGVLDCPASTPVAQVCGGAWLTYAPQLGIDVTARPAAQADGGAGSADPGAAAGCSLGGGGGRGTIAVLGLGLLLRVRRRRR